ncbi:GLYK [Symbiodinium natans]|uniref:GLYK protein n=1 Tax=Symbiodinium natans TaxID=878477 RepID=A0A812QHE3_9DINO|nr:GLYK [Symbiodinium natans]
MPPKLALSLAAVASLHAWQRHAGPTSQLSHRQVRFRGPYSPRCSVCCSGEAEPHARARARQPSARTKLDKVEDFVREGPLYKKLLLCSSPPSSVEWLRHGKVVVEMLRDREVGASALPEDLGDKMSRRIYHLYLPIFYWMRQQMLELRAAKELRGERSQTICFGVSAPQGCGKTTMTSLLQTLFRSDGLSCESLSIDDFYIPASRLKAVSDLNPENPLMQTRGNAGTHDVQLGIETLQALRTFKEDEVALPRYDKSAHDGSGDQVPRANWEHAHTPCDVVLLEGWMLGFKPKSEAEVARIHPGLVLVNQKLKDYQAWDDQIDSFCVFAVDDIDQVYAWRQQAETEMKQTRGAGMTPEAVKKFIDNYMPAYAAYRRDLYEAAQGGGVDRKPSLLCWVGPDRLPYDESDV